MLVRRAGHVSEDENLSSIVSAAIATATVVELNRMVRPRGYEVLGMRSVAECAGPSNQLERRTSITRYGLETRNASGSSLPSRRIAMACSRTLL